MRFFQIFLFVFLIIITHITFGQQRINIDSAGILSVTTVKGEQVRKLIDNVILSQGNTKIFGDSVFLYPTTNTAEIFGKTVRVEQGDTITITGKKLIYKGNEKIAEMQDNVVYKDPSMTLYTDYLNYDMTNSLAYYYNGGKIVDSTNVLTSLSGTYNTNSNLAAFKDSVVLVNPQYRLNADTLEYNTTSKVAFTKGPTQITSNDGSILYAKAGSEYKTSEKQSSFILGEVETRDYLISGDQLFSDDINHLYTAEKNVTMVSKDNNLIINGDYAIYKRNEGITEVYGHALMKKIMRDDTLYLSADTLVSIEDSIPDNKRILAYENVKIYKTDLQGKSDSMAYHVEDSIIYFYHDPVLWNTANQIEADTIDLEIIDGKPYRMNANQNSFVVSRDTLKNFNQVKGRDLIAYFDNGKINHINVIGNGESIYHALQGDTILVGMNRLLCSEMVVLFNNNQVSDIKNYVNPEGSFIPPHEITSDNSKLDNFIWRIEEKPTKYEVINHIQKPKVKDPLAPGDKLPTVKKLESKINP